MIQVVQETLNTDDEPNAKHLFDVFETLLILVRSTVASRFVTDKSTLGDSFTGRAYTSI